MKKRVRMLLLVFCAATVFAGCGKNTSEADKKMAETADESAKAEEAETSSEDIGGKQIGLQELLLEYNGLDYVTLGDYKGLEVRKQSTQSTDEKLQEAVAQSLSVYTKEIIDRVTQEGDVVEIAYEGKIAGDIQYDGITSEGVSITIGSSGYIEGFDEGLVNREIGETFDLELQFPEDYSLDESLAGQEVVFTVTINRIAEKITMEEVNDEWVAANTEFASMDEYTADQAEKLIQRLESEAERTLNYTLWEAVQAVCTVNEVPQKLKEAYVEYVMADAAVHAEQYNIETSAFIEGAYGMTEEEYREQMIVYSDSYVGELLLMLAIAEKENLLITEENYDTEVAKLAESSGLEAAYLEENKSRSDLIITMCNNNVMELVKETAVITTEEAAMETDTY